MNVRALADLTAAELEEWHALYAAAGSRVQQSPDYAAALEHAGEDVAVVIGGDAVAVLTIAGGRATMACADILVLPPGPAESAIVADVLTRVHQVTGLPVYMPLADPSYAVLAALGSFRTWERSPNSIIDWSRDGADLLERVRERGGSQAARKQQIIERDGLALDTARYGKDAARDMLAVDDRSWKARAGQGMRQRGHQAGLYSRLISQGTATVTFLRPGRTVAFRITHGRRPPDVPEVVIRPGVRPLLTRRLPSHRRPAGRVDPPRDHHHRPLRRTGPPEEPGLQPPSLTHRRMVRR